MAWKKEVKVTLGELLEEKSTSEILDRLKILAEDTLPKGWKSEEVSQVAKDDNFIEKVDETALNKLAYALPTVGLVKAFDPEADHLSERGFLQMKKKLLEWSFTRALIIGPPAIANQIRGSALKTEMFKLFVVPIKPLLLTREEADKILDEDAYRKDTPSGSKGKIVPIKYVKETAGRVLSGTSTRTGNSSRSSESLRQSEDERLEYYMARHLEEMNAILLARLTTLKRIHAHPTRRNTNGTTPKTGNPLNKVRKH